MVVENTCVIAALWHNGHCAYAGRLDPVTPGWRVRVITRRFRLELFTQRRRLAARKNYTMEMEAIEKIKDIFRTLIQRYDGSDVEEIIEQFNEAIIQVEATEHFAKIVSDYNREIAIKALRKNDAG